MLLFCAIIDPKLQATKHSNNKSPFLWSINKYTHDILFRSAAFFWGDDILHRSVLLFHFYIVIHFNSTNIKHVVTSSAHQVNKNICGLRENACVPNQHFAECANGLAVLEFFCICQLSNVIESVRNAYGAGLSSIYLEVHVVIDGNKVSLVFTAPLQLDSDRFASEFIKKRFGVDRNKLSRSEYKALSMEVFRLTADIITVSWKRHNGIQKRKWLFQENIFCRNSFYVTFQEHNASKNSWMFDLHLQDSKRHLSKQAIECLFQIKLGADRLSIVLSSMLDSRFAVEAESQSLIYLSPSRRIGPQSCLMLSCETLL